MFGFKMDSGLFPNGMDFIPPYEQEYTPDFPWLERHDWVNLFVYDEMMLNRSKYSRILEHSFSLSKAFTKNNTFAMWKKKLGTESFPIALEGADRVYGGCGITSRKILKMNTDELRPGILGRIKGEVHCVRPEVFWNGLDKTYLNGVEFERQRVKILVPYTYQGYSDEFIKEVPAWMYVGNRDYWLDQLDGGVDFSPVGCFNPKIHVVDNIKIGIYYHYSRLEYETNF